MQASKFFLGDSLVSQKNKKQDTVTPPRVEAQYILDKIVWVTCFLLDLHIKLTTQTPPHCKTIMLPELVEIQFYTSKCRP